MMAMALAASVQAGPVLRVVVSGAGQTNLLRNAGFETAPAGRFSSWSAASEGYRAAAGEGRGGSNALACEAPEASGWRGASQSLTLNRTVVAPITVQGWSRAAGVSGSADNDYSLYVDVLYADGTPLWGQTGNFKCGTHDWEQRTFVIMPEKPVRSLSFYCLFRGHSGKVWFDDVSVQEVSATGNAVLFQGTPMELMAATNPPPVTARSFATQDGLKLGVAGQQVTALEIDGRNVASAAPGGFFARDIGAGSDAFGFADGMCPELGLRIETSITAQADHLVVQGRVADTRGADRAVMLVFALPVEATAWTWGDDIRRDRKVEGRGEFANVTSVRCGTTGTMSLYPLGTVHNAQSGVALAIDMNQPAVHRLFYHAGTRQLCVAFDFGLAPETERFPGAADFRFVIYRYDPRWGFRAAWQKFTGIFPEQFVVRSREQGIWMPFTDISTVQDWQDFGFRYHEGNNAVPFDDQNGILSFRYLEPMTWWMPMKPELPRTPAEAERVRNEYAQGANAGNRRLAEITKAAAMTDAEGSPELLFRNEPWANGAVWSLNPNPFLPASPNAGTIHWNEPLKNELYGPTAKGRLDGEYIDSIEGYVTAELNFRREHFRYTTVPLTFDSEERRPALFKGLAVFEFTRWLSADLHRLDKLVFANGVPYRFAFLCPWLDVLGTETDWMMDGQYRPVAESQLCLWRTLAGQKPYLLLMNTDYERFAPEFVERYFQRSLFYGMFPSMFSHNASENPYWQNPKWYNRDRPLFRKYLPLIKRIAEAGWQPVTRAVCDNPSIQIERFGPGKDGATFFTLMNDTAQVQAGELRPAFVGGPTATPSAVTNLLDGARLPWNGTGWPVTLPAGSVTVVRVEAGPRFAGVETVPGGKLRLTIESPAAVAPILETSPDLHDWLALNTNTPTTSPFTIEAELAPSEPHRYFRLRW